MIFRPAMSVRTAGIIEICANSAQSFVQKILKRFLKALEFIKNFNKHTQIRQGFAEPSPKSILMTAKDRILISRGRKAENKRNFRVFRHIEMPFCRSNSTNNDPEQAFIIFRKPFNRNNILPKTPQNLTIKGYVY
jgi:hypothetical protein